LAVSTTTSANYTHPALIGGLVLGVLSALPIVAAGNLCCCLWVVSGGVVASYIFQQNHTGPMSPGDGALVGLLAGLVGAFVQTIVSIPVEILVAPMERAMLLRFMDIARNMPPEMRDALDRYSSSGAPFGVIGAILRRVIGLMFMLCIGAIFSTLGGLLGALIFRKESPAGTIDVAPTN
jgi:uncharacterized protein YqgC (DUF456 family)